MYKNHRLKHVKEIEKICCSMGINEWDAQRIFAQCNLLLETKKAKKRKCEHGVPFLKDSETGKITNWTACKICKPYLEMNCEHKWEKNWCGRRCKSCGVLNSNPDPKEESDIDKKIAEATKQVYEELRTHAISETEDAYFIKIKKL